MDPTATTGYKQAGAATETSLLVHLLRGALACVVLVPCVVAVLVVVLMPVEVEVAFLVPLAPSSSLLLALLVPLFHCSA